MTTYRIGKELTITRQEGDVADVVITVPDVLPMAGRTAVFGVFDRAGRQVFSKDVDIVVVGQVLSIPLLPLDTQRRSGELCWELEVTDSAGPITIGRGKFIVEPTLIR